jgi:hypothetical protein
VFAPKAGEYLMLSLEHARRAFLRCRAQILRFMFHRLLLWHAYPFMVRVGQVSGLQILAALFKTLENVEISARRLFFHACLSHLLCHALKWWDFVPGTDLRCHHHAST